MHCKLSFIMSSKKGEIYHLITQHNALTPSLGSLLNINSTSLHTPMKIGSVQPAKGPITIKLNKKEKIYICEPKENKLEMIITQNDSKFSRQSVYDENFVFWDVTNGEGVLLQLQLHLNRR